MGIDALVGDLDADPAVGELYETDPDPDRVVGVLDCVLEQVAEDHAELGLVAAHPEQPRAIEEHRFLGELVPLP